MEGGFMYNDYKEYLKTYKTYKPLTFLDYLIKIRGLCLAEAKDIVINEILRRKN